MEHFLPLDPTNIAKTGLGSSAALVSALTACLFSWGAGLTNLEHFQPHLDLAHNLAQLAHCHAQGKIGSGFDISSAFFGSQLYRRFDAKPLGSLMESASAGHLGPQDLYNGLSGIKVGFGGTVALPQGLKLVLGESGKDMHTPTSVKKVLDWLAESKDLGKRHFEELDASNQHMIELLRRLANFCRADAAAYNTARLTVSNWTTSDWAVSSAAASQDLLGTFRGLRQTFQNVRRLLKLMGDLAGTAIEPNEVTHVLDATIESVPGVLFAGAPGAGGYDAIFAVLVDDSQDQRSSLERFWLSNEQLPICPLLTGEDGSGIQIQIVS